jgi:hypothetical protein
MRFSNRFAALAAATIVVAAPAAAQQCPSRGPATVYVAQKIITMDPARPTATAVAVQNGRIQAVGDAGAVIRAVGGRCTVDTSFARRVMLPGFVEAHTHMQMYGFFNQLPYAGFYQRTLPDGSIRPGYTTWPEVRAYLTGVVDARLEAGDTAALYAYGTDPIFWGARLSSRQLDSVSTRIPILLQLGSGHIVVGNSRMMRLLMADTATFNALRRGGFVPVDSAGTPTGELDELPAVGYAIDVLRKHAPGVFTLPALVRGIRDGAGMMHRAGITTGTDLLFGVPGVPQTVAARALYMEQAAAGLPVRVALGYDAFQLAANHHNHPGRMVEALRLARVLDNEHVWTGPVKIIFDGSIQGYTAELDSPYYRPVGPTNPIWNITPDSLPGLMRPFWDAGFSITIHTNGDAAIEHAIAAARQMGRTHHAGQAVSLQHNQTAHLPDFAAMKSLGMMVNLFTPHLYFYGDQHRRYTLGDARAAAMNNVRWADSLGIPYSLHSDAPVTVADPLLAAWAAVARTTCSGAALGPDHRVSVDRALRAITLGGATLLGRQDVIGSIERGKWADFTVLDQDPGTPDALLTAKVVATVVGGRVHPIANPSARTPQPACTAGPR